MGNEGAGATTPSILSCVYINCASEAYKDSTRITSLTQSMYFIPTKLNEDASIIYTLYTNAQVNITIC